MCKCTNQDKEVMSAFRESNCVMDLHHNSHNLDLEEYILQLVVGVTLKLPKFLGLPIEILKLSNPIILQTHNLLI
jgi:hypothetical protein